MNLEVGAIVYVPSSRSHGHHGQAELGVVRLVAEYPGDPEPVLYDLIGVLGAGVYAPDEVRPVTAADLADLLADRSIDITAVVVLAYEAKRRGAPDAAATLSSVHAAYYAAKRAATAT